MIANIIAALVAFINSLKTPNSVQNDISDAIAVLALIEGIDPGLALAGGALQVVQKIEAENNDLTNNQAALLGTVGASFNGQPDKVMVLAIRESSPLAKQLFGV